jgi:hypothetical protein
MNRHYFENPVDKYIIPKLDNLQDQINVFIQGQTGPTGPTGVTGSIGATGSTGSIGIPGTSTGLIYYFNYSQPTNVPNYKTLSVNQTVTSGSATAMGINANTTNILLASFITTLPLNTTFIPPGLWDINIFAKASNIRNVVIYAQMYIRDSYGNESLIIESLPQSLNTLQIQQYSINVNFSYTPIGSNSLIIKLIKDD